jgi:hypothetical protein
MSLCTVLRLARFTLPVTFSASNQLPKQRQISRFELPFHLVIDYNCIAKAHRSADLTINLKHPARGFFGVDRFCTNDAKSYRIRRERRKGMTHSWPGNFKHLLLAIRSIRYEWQNSRHRKQHALL